ncbi:MAG: hypothetical protein HQK49_22225 [Oligoflexia bacterium]|nr:hypothetical protein [Oligoflexia bacterium]
MNSELRIIYLWVFVASCLILASYVSYYGVAIGLDSVGYSNWADQLIAYHFNIKRFLEEVHFHVPIYLYLGFITLVAVLKLLFGAGWTYALVALNCLCIALVAIMLSYLVYRLTRDKHSVGVAVFLFLGNLDILLWTKYVLSDSSYLCLNFLCYFLIVLLSFKHSFKILFLSLLLLFCVLVANILYRPTGLAMIAIVLGGLILNNRRVSSHRLFWKIFLITLFGIVILAIIIHTFVLTNYSSWPFDFGKEYWNNLVLKDYLKGVVVYDRPYTFHQSPQTYVDFMFITLDKIFHFFFFITKDYSFIHNTINALIFGPTYFLFGAGIFMIVMKKQVDNSTQRFAVSLALLVITIFTIYHSLTQIDFDWRYRISILPYIIVVSSFGVLYLKNTFFKFK